MSLTINEEADFSRHREPFVAPRIVHRKLPQSEESETAFIASAFIAPEPVRAMAAQMGITPEWFHIPCNRTLWKRFCEIVDGGGAFDVFTLTKALQDAREIDSVGGYAGLTAMFTHLPTAANARYYAEAIAEKHTLRAIIQGCTDTIARAYDDQGSVASIVEGLEHTASSIALRRYKTDTGTVRDSVMNVLNKVASGYTEEAFGVSTGYTSLDAVVRGMSKGHMWSIAGASSAGKTSFALNLIYNVCVKQGHKTLVFTLETNRDELVEVLIQIGSGVNIDQIAKGRASQGEHSLFQRTADDLSKAPLVVIDDTDISISQVRSIARREKPRFIMLDYAQLMTGSQRKYDRQDQEVAEISRSAKKMAGELACTALLISQLNDDGKMAGSRSILKDSDQSLLVEDGKSDVEKIVKVVKQRRGKKTAIPFRWNGPSQEFIQKSLSGE